ncbi:MAG: arginine--tRNA ligase [Mariprofundaceae bacterium]
MKQDLEKALDKAVLSYVRNELNDDTNLFPAILSRPRQKEHGDYSCNVAMAIASKMGVNPRDVAEKILSSVEWPSAVEGTDIAGPGFINIRLKHASEAEVVKKIVQQGEAYGRIEISKDAERVNLEFVSANPTGPMHVGHGRGAVVGDSLGRILAARGFDVCREYYINDAGTQIGVLARSLWKRVQQQVGIDVELSDGEYPGEYLIDTAEQLLKKYSFDALNSMDHDIETWPILVSFAIENMMAMIRNDLAALGVEFDHYFSEQTLHESGKVKELIEQLKADDLIYLGTLPPPKGKEIKDYKPVEQWLFRTTNFGDDVDRPLAKQDGTPTYFAADIAYHMDKFERGFKRQIDIWGADHGGYVTRVQSAVKALTGLEGQPEVLLVQMVNLMRGGEQVKMSKRAGTFVTLREVVDEVGVDAVRFNFMTRRVESQLDFDLETAKQKSDENPVYYVQYAHARVCAILRKAADEDVTFADVNSINTSRLTSDEEKHLVAQLLGYPEMLDKAANRHEAYRVAVYLMDFARSLHGFYHKHRVISDDEELTQARILLVRAVGQVIRNGLSMLGVSSPERM